MLPVSEELHHLTKYQAFLFKRNGKFLRASNSKPFSKSQIFRIFSTASISDSYTLNKEGVLSMRFSHVPDPDVALCSITTTAGKTSHRLSGKTVKHRRGDLSLTYYSSAAKPRFQLYLRKLKRRKKTAVKKKLKNRLRSNSGKLSQPFKTAPVSDWNEGVKRFQNGDIKGAKVYWERCLSKQPSNQDCKIALQRLKNRP